LTQLTTIIKKKKKKKKEKIGRYQAISFPVYAHQNIFIKKDLYPAILIINISRQKKSNKKPF